MFYIFGKKTDFTIVNKKKKWEFVHVRKEPNYFVFFTKGLFVRIVFVQIMWQLKYSKKSKFGSFYNISSKNKKSKLSAQLKLMFLGLIIQIMMNQVVEFAKK